MKSFRTAALVAIGFVALAAGVDRLAFSEEFGLWTYTLSTIAGLSLAVLGLLIILGKLFFSRQKNLSAGVFLLFAGLLTFFLALLVWTAAGKPLPRETPRSSWLDQVPPLRTWDEKKTVTPLALSFCKRS